MLDPVEYQQMSDLLAFADIPPVRVPCFPVTQQIAEKFHAYTRPRGMGENSRVKDLVDILLLAGLGDLSGERLYRALRATFEHANTHSLPDSVPPPPQGWRIQFHKMAQDIGLEETALERAYHAICEILNPVLSNAPPLEWQSGSMRWRVDDEGGD